jgi:hypothetical protein
VKSPPSSRFPPPERQVMTICYVWIQCPYAFFLNHYQPPDAFKGIRTQFMMSVDVPMTVDGCSTSPFSWLLIRSFARQLAWEPPIPRKIDIHLAHAVCSNLHAFLCERFGLTLRTAGSTTIVVSREQASMDKSSFQVWVIWSSLK